MAATRASQPTSAGSSEPVRSMKRRLRSAAPEDASPLAKGLETPRKRRKVSPAEVPVEEAPAVTAPATRQAKPKAKKTTMRMARLLQSAAQAAAAKAALVAEMEVDAEPDVNAPEAELNEQEMADQQELVDVVSCCFFRNGISTRFIDIGLQEQPGLELQPEPEIFPEQPATTWAKATEQQIVHDEVEPMPLVEESPVAAVATVTKEDAADTATKEDAADTVTKEDSAAGAAASVPDKEPPMSEVQEPSTPTYVVSEATKAATPGLGWNLFNNIVAWATPRPSRMERKRKHLAGEERKRIAREQQEAARAATIVDIERKKEAVKAKQQQESARAAEELAAQEVGKKRKRVVQIPPPRNGGYGIDPSYYDECTSSEEEDEEQSPVAKKQRHDTSATSTPSPFIRADKYAAFTEPDEPESPFDSLKEAPWQKGTSNLGAGRFVVPDESSDEEDEDEDNIDVNDIPTPEPATFAPSRPSRLSTITEVTEVEEEKEVPNPAMQWSQPPPPTPTPAHASLPWGLASDRANIFQQGDDALARARLAAEKYKPKTPSGLRAASRMSTPNTGGSDHVEAAQELPNLSSGESDVEYAPQHAPLNFTEREDEPAVTDVLPDQQYIFPPLDGPELPPERKAAVDAFVAGPEWPAYLAATKQKLQDIWDDYEAKGWPTTFN